MIDVMVHDGLYCSIADAGMGGMSDAENARLGITRAAQDEFAARSHASARRPGREPAGRGDRAARRARPRRGRPRETELERLAALPPAFTRDGTITAGNASQVSDGAAAAVVTTARPRASDAAGRGASAARSSPARTRPCTCAPPRPRAKLLARHGLKPRRHRPVGDQRGVRGRRARLGHARSSIDLERVNVNGGAVALGHPLAGSGLRLVLTLAYELRRRGGGLGVATLCGGGGQGEAILLRV